LATILSGNSGTHAEAFSFQKVVAQAGEGNEEIVFAFAGKIA
jgi:hypothetical protein